MSNTVMSRSDAVACIAGHLADRDAFVVSAPPELLATLGEKLAERFTWTAYVDNGTGPVLTTDRAVVLHLVELMGVATAVVAVPKTVPASVLSAALEQHIATDGSQDIVLLQSDGDGPIIWPTLFVDALDVVDPVAAAQIRVSEIGAQS